MAPPAADVNAATASAPEITSAKLQALQGAKSTAVSTKPLAYAGTLDEYQSFDVTPVIGREYPEAKLLDILKDDAKIRDLAITGRSHFIRQSYW
jgi:hypothetical protein